MFWTVTPKSAEERARLSEDISGYATLLILAGIALEIVLIYIYRRDQTNWEVGWATAANLAIGLGLVAEYICIRVAIKAGSELKVEADAKLAQALTRAANAELALIEFKTPRRAVIAPKKPELIAQLNPYAGTEFDVGFSLGDGELADCAWDIEVILHKAGWSQLPWGVHDTGVSTIRRSLRLLAGQVSAQNIEVQMEPAHRQRLLKAAQELITSLKNIGIEARETEVIRQTLMLKPYTFLLAQSDSIPSDIALPTQQRIDHGQLRAKSDDRSSPTTALR
jgi:hypothetical protein